MREEAASFIIDEIERLDKTLKAFLAFSKPAPPSFSATDLVQLLDETLAATEVQMVAKGIRVEKALSSEQAYCQAGMDQIRQVFWNILINAVQAMPDGGRLTVEADCRMQDKEEPVNQDLMVDPLRELVIRIGDSGSGIPVEQADKIFEPFVSFRTDGIGMGLSIVYQILKLHRAIIEVVSQIDEGTTFILKFPCIDRL